MGETFGRYTLEDRLGYGGMAEVFRARAGERVVALKRVLPHLGDNKEFRSMFLDEVALALKLHHPNIVAALDAGEESGRLFLAMELVDGAPLSAIAKTLRTRNEAFPLAAAVDVAIHMCNGLHHAHTMKGNDRRALEVVHRDVSPQNVLVGVDGVAKVSDFGIARARQRLTKTGTGVLKGKPSYMSPEQVVDGTADHRADQFATGIVLWELVSGRALFEGPSEMKVLERVARCDVPALRTVRSDVPKELADVVHRALARNVDDRFPSMRAFASALEAVRARLPSGRSLVDLVRIARGTSDADIRSPATAMTAHARGQLSSPPPPSPPPLRTRPSSSRQRGLLYAAFAGGTFAVLLGVLALALTVTASEPATDAGAVVAREGRDARDAGAWAEQTDAGVVELAATKAVTFSTKFATMHDCTRPCTVEALTFENTIGSLPLDELKHAKEQVDACYESCLADEANERRRLALEAEGEQARLDDARSMSTGTKFRALRTCTDPCAVPLRPLASTYGQLTVAELKRVLGELDACSARCRGNPEETDKRTSRRANKLAVVQQCTQPCAKEFAAYERARDVPIDGALTKCYESCVADRRDKVRRLQAANVVRSVFACDSCKQMGIKHTMGAVPLDDLRECLVENVTCTLK